LTGFAPLQFWISRQLAIDDGQVTHLENCFFFAAFSFWVTGVIRLSVGEMKFGLLKKYSRSWLYSDGVDDVL
jgi:hypothetical protein